MSENHDCIRLDLPYGRMLKVEDVSENKVWISRESGEGGAFSKEGLFNAISKFYEEQF